MKKKKLTATSKLPFGKYKGLTIPAVMKIDSSYVKWFKDNIDIEWSEHLLKVYNVPEQLNSRDIKKSLMKEYNCVRYYDLKMLLGRETIESIVKERLNEN